MSQPQILIVDDERTLSLFLARSLERDGYQTRRAASVAEGWAALQAQPTDLLILDLKLPDGFGIEILQRMQEHFVEPPPALIITAHPNASSAVQAMQLHAFDYLEKPLRIGEVRQKVREALASRSVTRALSSARPSQEPRVIGDSPLFQETLKLVERIAPTQANVFLSGESGSGKEVIAALIHERSPRARSGRFVALNCAAIPTDLLESELFGVEQGAFTDAKRPRPGVIEQAHAGTLFLDEVDQLPLSAQGKLLRVLQERTVRHLGGTRELEVDFRLVCATNAHLPSLVGERRFRPDLFYRIHVIEIRVPPLRARTGDLERFVSHFLREFNHSSGRTVSAIEPVVMALFHRYSWPGNVRELRNVLERAVVLCDGPEIGLRHLPPELQALTSPPVPDTAPDAAPSPAARMIDLRGELARVERDLITRAMRDAGGQHGEAARLLGLSHEGLRDMLRRHRLDRAP